jgi:hypothetical protein
LEQVKIEVFNSEETKQIEVNREVADRINKKYLIFRPYVDPMSCKPFLPSDKGYYFKFHNTRLKIVVYTLMDNGFKDAPEGKEGEWIINWSASSLKTSFYHKMGKFQKVNHFPRTMEICRKDLLTSNFTTLM